LQVDRNAEILESYRVAAEALHDALLACSSRMYRGKRGEYERLSKLVEKCKEDLDQAHRDFRLTPEDLKRTG